MRLLFFALTVPNGEDRNLAFVKSLPVRTENRLVMIAAAGGRKFIDVLQIQEIIGVIEWEDEEYLVRKNGALFAVDMF